MLKSILTQNKCNKDTSLNVTEDRRVDFKSETEKASPMTHTKLEGHRTELLW